MLQPAYPGEYDPMSRKSNKALRARARMARPRAANSPVLALPAAMAISRRFGPRVVGLNAVAAAVAGILYCAGGTAYAQAQAEAAPADEASALNEIVVTASAT